MKPVEIICLANSWKRGGRCVAGIRTDTGEWICPVGAGDGHLTENQCCIDFIPVRLLDVLRIFVTEPEPRPNQPENWRTAAKDWQLLHRPAPKEMVPLLRGAICREAALLGGRSPVVSMSDFDECPAAASLTLAYPDNLRWQFRRKPNQPERREIRAVFTLKKGPQSCDYPLIVTDPAWYDRTHHLPDGDFPKHAGVIDPNDRILLTVSLGEPFGPERKCYKVVAAVIVVPKELRG